MMKLSQAAQALNTQLSGDDAHFTAVSTDTRSIKPGDLFVALKGQNFDGAKFVTQATQAGAVAAVVNADSIIENAPCALIRVADTRIALGQLAAYWRSQNDIPVVAITGSNGKTTVKEMLAGILRQKIKEEFHDSSAASPTPTLPRGERAHSEDSDNAVLATLGNFNNDIGMPLTLLRLRATHRYAVIEMGMNNLHEIEYLSRIARPNVALVNNASGAHLQGLGSVENVARAKGEVFAGLENLGSAVINADDAFAGLWRKLAQPHEVFDFALEHPAFAKGSWTAQGYGGVLQARTRAGELRLVLQVPGEHNARNALAAATAALALQIPLSTITRALEKFGGVAGRLQRKQAEHGATLIDDTYNANPASMRAALEVLSQASGKRVFVLGDMGELGEEATQMHREIGIAAREMGIERLFALGALSAGAVAEFGAGARHFPNVEELCGALTAELDKHTTVLVKGSRFMKMERVVQFCAQEKEATCCSH